MKRVLINQATGDLLDIVQPGQEFPVAAGLQWVDAPDDVSGETHEFNGTSVVTKAPPTLPEVKLAKLKLLDAEKQRLDTLRYGGNNNGTLFEITRPEIMQELSLGWITIKDNPVGTFTIRDDNGVEVTFTSTALNLVMPLILAVKKQASDRYWQRRAALDAATTQGEVDAINPNLTQP